MTAKRFGGWFGLGLVVVVAAVAVAAALLLPLGTVGAQGTPEVGCPRSEIVPGSITVTSTNREAGRVSGHTIRFRLCPPGESPAAAGDMDRPVKIGLRGRHGWFSLSNPVAAGIQLRRGDYSWRSDAAEELPAGPDSWSYSGVVFPFPPDDLVETGAGAAADWYFDIPAAAGMLNPRMPGESDWQLVFYYGPSSYCKQYARQVPLTILPRPSPEGILRLSENHGGPGTTVVVRGSGFPPLAPLQSIWASYVDLTPYHDLATDAQGNLEFEFRVPGLNLGAHHLTVEVNGGIVGVKFWVISSATDTGIDETPVSEVVERLDGNFVRSFHYRCDTKTWAFYDPAVGESDYNDHYTQYYFIAGRSYWILVKEPMEVILNRQTRDLTCQPDGKCWNFIVW